MDGQLLGSQTLAALADPRTRLTRRTVMANELSGLDAHSAEYFGDTRDHWWHDDYVEMLSRRWRVEEVGSVLDVGCGVGH